MDTEPRFRGNLKAGRRGIGRGGGGQGSSAAEPKNGGRQDRGYLAAAVVGQRAQDRRSWTSGSLRKMVTHMGRDAGDIVED